MLIRKYKLLVRVDAKIIKQINEQYSCLTQESFTYNNKNIGKN